MSDDAGRRDPWGPPERARGEDEDTAPLPWQLGTGGTPGAPYADTGPDTAPYVATGHPQSGSYLGPRPMPGPYPGVDPRVHPYPGTRPSAGPYPGAAPHREPGPWPVPDTLGRPVRERRRPTAGALLAAAAAVAIVAGGVGAVTGSYVAERDDETSVLDENASLGAPIDASDGTAARPPDSVAGIAARVLPSVVSIAVRSSDGAGTGSGFIIRADGYLLTNNHVVAEVGDGDIEVEFQGGEAVPATIVGTDPDYDLAVLKVDGLDGLQAAALGSSESVAVGDPVVAIGSPLGLAGTVTAGIVSSKNRPVTAGGGDDTSYINAIQTDAAINPGNSGGPLVNDQGQVIGVNSAIATVGSGSVGGPAGSIGLGFAIPIDQARRTAEQLIRTGKSVHPIIGASLDLTYEGEGVRLISEAPGDQPAILPGGPADDAGLLPGDVILAIDDVRVDRPQELIVAIRSRVPGETVQITYRRSGRERTVPVTLAASD